MSAIRKADKAEREGKKRCSSDNNTKPIVESAPRCS